MKKNKMMRIASVLLVAVLLSTCAISGTFAKYTSTATASDTARVAKWDIKTGANADGSFEENFAFNLFETIYDTDTTTTLKSEDSVDKTLVAPGTWGYFDIVITNKSEVDAKVKSATFTETLTNAPSGEVSSPIVYKVEVIADSAAPTEKPTITNNTSFGEQTLARGAKVIIRVYWEWAFNETNETAWGTGNVQIRYEANITVEQVD